MVYNPDNMPTIETLDDLREYVFSELQQISQEFNGQTIVMLAPVAALPLKPRDGMLIYADGVALNPGAGKGVYEYRSPTGWAKL